MKKEYIIYNRGKIHPYLKNFVIPLAKAITRENKLKIFSLGIDDSGEFEGKICQNEKSLTKNLAQLFKELKNKNLRKVYCLTENQVIAIKTLSWIARSKAKIVLYKQGALYEEKKYLKSKIPQLYWIIEAISLRFSDEVIFISKSMRNYYHRKFNFNGISWVINNKISHPQKIEHKTKNSISIVYSGSTGNWQCFEYISALMSKAVETLGIDFYIYTKDHLKKQNSKFIISNANQQELVNKLSAHDIGIIVRERHNLNIVSSPLKIGEYLGAGLHVLMTRDIGDYSEELKNEHLCTFITGNNLNLDLEVIKKLVEDKIRLTQKERMYEKKRASNFADKRFCDISDFDKVL